jgi:hypothetical protein
MTSPLKTASDAVSYRVDTIAATETSTAFETEHQRQAAHLQRASRETQWLAAVVKVWDSTLDTRLCSVCSSSTGEVRPLGIDFSSGTPGHAHPRCRCRSAIFVLPGTHERTE